MKCRNREEAEEIETDILSRLRRRRSDGEWVIIDEAFNEIIDEAFSRIEKVVV